jgi:hypothetical protein
MKLRLGLPCCLVAEARIGLKKRSGRNQTQLNLAEARYGLSELRFTGLTVARVCPIVAGV